MATSTTTYLITGARSGLGLEFVKQLAGRATDGHAVHVIATCRKKTSSATGIDHISDLAPSGTNKISVLEGIDVASDECKDKLIAGLAGANCADTIDVVVHNAGGLGSKDKAGQSFESVTPEIILNNVNLNGIGPLRVQQALHSGGYMGKEGGKGKVVVITSGLGSIGDNTSGGYYAYRGSKAYVNMITKSMSCDLKDKGVSVMALAPGFVATEFGGFGQEQLTKWGAMPVEKSVGQMIRAIDGMTIETTGKFVCVDKNGDEAKEFEAGW